MSKVASLRTKDGKLVEVYAENSDSDQTSDEDFDDLLCFWCDTEIDNYTDEAFYHELTNQWYCEGCYTFMLDNE